MQVKSSSFLKGCRPNHPIALFDSGVGGLSILQALQEALPTENFIYFADTARLPYGEKENDEILSFSTDCAFLLYQKGCKMIVVACHTASTIALKSLKALLPLPIIGVAEAGAAAAAATTRNCRIALLATQKTVGSHYFEKELGEKQCTLLSLACPLLASLVEKGEADSAKARALIRDYVNVVKNFDADTLLLGCTHYHFLRPFIEKEAGEAFRVVDCRSVLAAQVAEILKEQRLATDALNPSKVQYYTSGNIEQFNGLKEQLFENRAHAN
ncbi:MAG: glutamate racemase [Parachlamydia sp.]|jgi:glutamate racemase|nr:glutamate racemase [Parachlamydia sp.]